MGTECRCGGCRRQGGGLDLHSVSLQEAQELQRRVHELERKVGVYAGILSLRR